LLAENFDRTFVPSNLNFYANPYSSHNFQFPQKTDLDELYNFLKNTNVVSAYFFCDQPFGQPISYAFPFFVTASKTRRLLSFKNISKFNV